MASFRELFNRMATLEHKIRKTESEISEKLNKTLGDGWAITQQTDGACICNADGENFLVNLDELADKLKGLPPEDIIEWLEPYGI